MRWLIKETVAFLSVAWIAGMVPCVHLSSLQFVSTTECDRLSLDALYHEKFSHITEDVLNDSLEFANHFMKRTVDSLMEIMANLPGRESSSKEELDVFRNFDTIKRKFSKGIKDIKRNVTDSWNLLLETNFDVLLGKKGSSLESLRDHVNRLTEEYKTARRSLDTSLATVFSPIKVIVRDGLRSIVNLAKAQQLQNNKTEDAEVDPTEEEDNKEEEIQKIVTNITTTIIPSFLGRLTLLVLEKKINLENKVDFKPGEGDSPFDDLYFSLLIIKARINSIIYTDLPKSEDQRDLARREVYIYWADLVTTMLDDKKKGDRIYTTSTQDRQTKYTQLWSNEDELAQAAVKLMQIYP